MPSSLLSNPYEQWVHTYLIVASDPIYGNPPRYESGISYDAWLRGLYTIPKPDNRTMAEEGWLNFVKGIQSIYEIETFRAACTKAKEVLRNPQDLKKDLDLWATPCQAEAEREAEQAKKKAEELQSIRTATLELLRKEVENAQKKEASTHDDLWNAEANEEESTADYNRVKGELKELENLMKEMIQVRKDADTAYVAAQKNVEGAKKALELVLAAVEPTPTAAAAATMIPSCNLPFTDNKFKSLKPCKAILNPGTYYIGDPCYPLGKSWIYKKAWDASAYSSPAYFHSGRGTLVVAHTAWGDGSYHEHNEEKVEKTRKYLVDSGTISIISVGLIHDEVERRQKNERMKPQTFKSLTRGGHIHTFTEKVEIHFYCGIFHFSSGDDDLCINTEGFDSYSEETDDEDMDE